MTSTQNGAMAQAFKNANIGTIEGAMKEEPKATTPAKIDEHAAEKLSSVSTATFISAITNATMSYKYALQLELATGLVLFAEAGEANRDSKRALQQVYISAGYDCADQYKQDYKTIRRRIDASATLFDWMEIDTILKLIDNRAEMNAIMAVVQHLEQYNLKGINSVLALCGKPVILKREKPADGDDNKQPKGEAKKTHSVKEYQQKQKEASASNAPANEKEGQQASSREQQAAEGTRFLNTEHIRVEIAASATKAELMDIAMKMLAIANALPDVEASKQPTHAKEEQEEPTDGQLQTIKGLNEAASKPEANGNVAPKPAEKKPRVHRATRRTATA